MSLVELGREGAVRVIRLNAPGRRNALDWPLLEELRAAVAHVAGDPDAGALVVCGAGRAFCAGADLSGLFGDRTRPVAVLREDLLRVYGSFLGVRDLEIPTIAAVHGAAVGAGLNIALACDVIIAGAQAKFAPTFASIGLHPGGGCTWMLTQRLGPAGAAALLYAGASVDGREAHRLGLAQELVDDPCARACELAATYAAHNRQVMADIKSSIRIASTSDLRISLASESWAQASSLATPEFERFVAGFTKSQP